MPQPLDFVEDWKVTRADDLELVTVESLDPDLAPPGDVLATETGVTALVGREGGGESAIGNSGTAGVTKRDFTLMAEEIGFEVKTRDRITRADGTKWLVGMQVDSGGFDGELVVCEQCEEQR